MQTVACIRCAVRHPDRVPTPLAYRMEAQPGSWKATEHGLNLLHKAVRAIDPHEEHSDYGEITPWFTSYGSAWEHEPLAARADQPVQLQCPACFLRIGPISAKAVGRHFRDGRDRDGVLLLPLPPAGVDLPVSTIPRAG